MLRNSRRCLIVLIITFALLLDTVIVVIFIFVFDFVLVRGLVNRDTINRDTINRDTINRDRKWRKELVMAWLVRVIIVVDMGGNDGVNVQMME